MQVKFEGPINTGATTPVRTGQTDFADRGLARRKEGKMYAGHFGERQRKRALRQAARQEEKDAGKIVIATCGPGGLLHQPSPAEVAGILAHHRPDPYRGLIPNE